MANLKVTLELDNQGYLRAIRASDDATKKFAADAKTAADQSTTAFDKLNQTTERVRGQFAKLSGAIVGLGLVALTRSAIQSSDAIVDLANATEFSVAKIMELQQALQLSGGEAQNSAKLITEFYKSIDEAAKGGDKTQESFAKVGVSLQNLAQLNTMQLFDQAVAGLAKINDPAERAATAIQLFGKSMVGVNPADLSAKLAELRGNYEQQAIAAQHAADLNDKYTQAINNLRTAFLTVAEPILNFVNSIAGSQQQIEQLVSILRMLGIAIAAAFAFTGFGLIVRVIGTIGRGFTGLLNIIKNFKGAINENMFAPMSSVMKMLRGIGGLLAGVAGGVAAFMGLGGGAVGSPEDQTAAETARLARQNAAAAGPSPERTIEIGKELKGQLDTINSMADGYRRAAQANMDRYTQEVEMLGKSKEEQEMIKGTAEIEKRYADARAALEDKKKNAKGATLALINKEIKDLEQLKQSELDIFNITREQISAYQRQQQEARNMIALMEEQADIAREIAAFQAQQDQARLAAFEQVKAIKDNLALTTQREQLEKSIALLRGTDQEAMRKIFDLEQSRAQELEKIAKIQNLPYEERLAKEAEINELYNQRRALIEQNYVTEKINQDSFVQGWQDAFTRWRNNFKTDAEYAGELFGTLTRGFEDAFVRFVQTGKLSFKSLANDMIAQATRMAANRLLMSILGGAGGSPIGSFFSSLFGGGRAAGGPVNPDTAYVVGERGPELFVPNNAGKIVPNKDLMGNNNAAAQSMTQVNYNIQAVDASSFRSLVARDPEFIFNVTEQGRRSMPTRARR